MTPAARISAAIELVDLLRDALDRGNSPADAVVNEYFRSRRYAGSKDRRAVKQMFFDILRDWQRLESCARQHGLVPVGRTLVIAFLATQSITFPYELFGSGDRHAPGTLDHSEKLLVVGLKDRQEMNPSDPSSVNLPLWATDAFRRRYGDAWLGAANCLNQRAPLAIRANTLKTRPEELESELIKAGISITRGVMMPETFFLDEGTRLDETTAYREGWLEVQDQSAQIAARLADARPGMSVLDLCAGAGGKSLAVAATMQNRGKIVAADISGKRLQEATRRFARAGVTIGETRKLPTEPELRANELIHPGGFDRIIVDAPCGGSGTWRRSPELRLKHQLGSDWMGNTLNLQAALLDEAADHVSGGGRLVYMTCSVLGEENEDQVLAFLSRNPAYRLLNWQDIWQEIMSDAMMPQSRSLVEEALQMTPDQENHDGFFVAVLERSAKNHFAE